MVVINDKLLEEISNYLDITWEMTEKEKEKLRGIAARGASFLLGKIGDCDFDNETQEKTLLFNYVMYERAGAANEFMDNYRSEIVALQTDRWYKNADSEKQEI